MRFIVPVQSVPAHQRQAKEGGDHTNGSASYQQRHPLPHRTYRISVIDDFLPSLTLTVSWSRQDALLGNTIKPSKLRQPPEISLHDIIHSIGSAASALSYVITLTDPDAPTRENPEWSEFCHWIAANVSITPESMSAQPKSIRNEDSTVSDGRGDDVVEYKPPGPPKKTGKHRYMFLVFAPKNGTTEVLNLTEPKERKHWGTGKERGGVRDWALENGLVPVAANFIYAENKKQ